MRVDWVEPFSNHLQMKSCPGEGQTAWCIAPVHKALTGILDVLFWVEIIEFCFPFWQQTSGLYFERMLVLKPVKLCQSWSRDLRVCSAASFVSGLIVAREKILHLPTRSHNAYTLSFFSCISLFLCFLSLSLSLPQNSIPHTDLLYTTTLYFLCMYGGVSLFFPCFSSPSQQDVSSGTQKSRSFGACLLLKHSCVTVSDTHTNSDVWRKVIALPGFISSVFLS